MQVNIDEAISEFITMCHEVKNATTNKDFEIYKAKAMAYSNAVKTLIGTGVWGVMVMKADISFDESIIACAGIPMFFNNCISNP